MADKKKASRPADAAGVGPYARELDNLVPLSGMSGWNVVDGEVDIRSWEVRTVSGRVIGSVRELLVDPKAGEVVMLDVDLAGTPAHAYVPLRVVEIDRTKRVVRADSADLVSSDARSDEAHAGTELAEGGTVRYADGTAERVIERRPMVEETVVRRRDADVPEDRV